MKRHPLLLIVLVILAVGGSACAGARAYRNGAYQATLGNWDEAVVHYRRALDNEPARAEYKIALERAMLNASRVHMTRAREMEEKDELSASIQEYRKASEYDPSNTLAATKAATLERTLRDRVEAARPKPAIEQMRERARQASAEPVLDPASKQPLPRIKFEGANVKDILNFMGSAAGINVTYERDYQAQDTKPYTVQLDNVTFEQALTQILQANQLFYKILNERTIMVIQDTAPKRMQYEEQVIRTFYVSHAEIGELSQLVGTIIRVPNMAIQPMVAINKTANTLTVRASAQVAAIIERIIQANDKPRAEIVLDVEILEVNRTRAKQYGFNLSSYSIGGIFSPETAPDNKTSISAEAVTGPGPFNVNTISQGVSTLDFYGVVPAAYVRFLESDSQTKLVAKPQLRGSEGQKLTLNLGDEIPVPSTTFTPIAGGGASVNPLTSFAYKPVGVNLEMTPRVTYDGEIIIDLLVESSTLGQNIIVGGSSLPTFGSRKVVTKLRLREGESTLLAGLLREDTRRALRGVPGVLRLPVLKQLLADNDSQVSQTDIVMLLTPRIVRTHQLTQEDLNPIYIGTQQNIGLGGPPPLIAPPAGGAAPEPQPSAAPPPAGTTPPIGTPPQPGTPIGPPTTAPGGRPVVPPGSSPIPGTITGTATTPPAPGAPPGVLPPGPVTPPAIGTPPGAPTTPPGGLPPPPPPATPPATPPPATTPPAAQTAQLVVTPPGTEFRVGGGPYTVPISITGATQITALTITLTFNPATLRVRNIQEAGFMRQGGMETAFAQQVDPSAGRIDISVTRTGDATGASGAGLIAAIVFDAAGAGSATITPSGTGTAVGGRPVTVQASPVTVTVR